VKRQPWPELARSTAMSSITEDGVAVVYGVTPNLVCAAGLQLYLQR